MSAIELLENVKKSLVSMNNYINSNNIIDSNISYKIKSVVEEINELQGDLSR
jgi:hypothetical protein